MKLNVAQELKQPGRVGRSHMEEDLGHQEYLGRVEVLKSDAKEIVFEPYHWRPWFLCAGDLSDNPDDEANSALASWYDKDTIICIDKD